MVSSPLLKDNNGVPDDGLAEAHHANEDNPCRKRELLSIQEDSSCPKTLHPSSAQVEDEKNYALTFETGNSFLKNFLGHQVGANFLADVYKTGLKSHVKRKMPIQ